MSTTRATTTEFDDARLKALATELWDFYAYARGNRAHIDAAIGWLRLPLCTVTKMLVPNVRQKIDEYIVAADNGLTVRDAANGADTTDADGNCWEIKADVLTADGRCNPCWPIPSVLASDPPETSKRSKLIASVEAKTRGGGAIIEIRTAEHVEVAEYTLSSRFLVTYFTHLPIGPNKSNQNLGCAQCRVCGSFHRLDAMVALDKAMQANPAFTFDATHAIYKRIAAHCAEKKKKGKGKKTGTTKKTYTKRADE